MKFTLKQILESPKTSILGLVSALCASLALAPGLEHGTVKDWGLALLAAAGPLVLGLFGADEKKE